MYGLSSSWLNVRQQRQLDGFQARCLREISRIPHPFYSRVSNKTVLARCSQKPLTMQLRFQQFMMLGKIARAPDSDVRRRLTFCPGSLRPATDRFVRRVGRPRNEWAPKLLQLAVQKWGTLNTVERLMHNEMIWKAEVARHF